MNEPIIGKEALEICVDCKIRLVCQDRATAKAAITNCGKYRPETVDVSQPEHYKHGTIEPKDFIMANKMNWAEGNIVKYITRHRYKNGLEDLKKAQVYLTYLMEEYNDKV